MFVLCLGHAWVIPLSSPLEHHHWGIHSTRDVGSVVFALVEQKILTTQDGDCPEDFADVFDFEEAFELNYPWEARI